MTAPDLTGNGSDEAPVGAQPHNGMSGPLVFIHLS